MSTQYFAYYLDDYCINININNEWNLTFVIYAIDLLDVKYHWNIPQMESNFFFFTAVLLLPVDNKPWLFTR